MESIKRSLLLYSAQSSQLLIQEREKSFFLVKSVAKKDEPIRDRFVLVLDVAFISSVLLLHKFANGFDEIRLFVCREFREDWQREDFVRRLQRFRKVARLVP